jgi:regulator of protease activity HflC (stomatin/prohibitin superfamily)
MPRKRGDRPLHGSGPGSSAPDTTVVPASVDQNERAMTMNFGTIRRSRVAVPRTASASMAFYTIDETRRGVLLRNGAFVEVVQPGLHFKWPIIEDVRKIDMQTHTFTWQKLNSYSADQQPADLKVSVTLHVAADKVADMYSRFSGDQQAAVDRIISPHVAEKLKVVFGQYTAARAISNRATLNSDSAKALIEAIAYDPVFVIESVQIENIDFSVEYIRSVEQRMQAEVEVQRLRQNLEREKVQAEIVVTQATARANGVRAAAQAERTRSGSWRRSVRDHRARQGARRQSQPGLAAGRRWTASCRPPRGCQWAALPG